MQSRRDRADTARRGPAGSGRAARRRAGLTLGMVLALAALGAVSGAVSGAGPGAGPGGDSGWGPVSGPSPSLLRAARAGGVHARWQVARTYLDRGDDVRAVRWLRMLVADHDRRAQRALAEIDPDAYRGLARRLRVRRGRIASPVGSPTRVTGRLVAVSPSRWTVALNRTTAPTSVEIDASGLRPDDRLHAGLTVIVHGILEPDGVVALLYDVPAPAYDVEWMLVSSGVSAHSARTHHVLVSVRNTGLQPIRAIALDVRLHQHRGASGPKRTIRLGPLEPGRSTVTRVPVRLVSGSWASAPRAEVALVAIEW